MVAIADRIADIQTERWVTLQEAMKIMKVSRMTIYRYIKITKTPMRMPNVVDQRIKYIDINDLKRRMFSTS